MADVYILYSEKLDKYYIGSCIDIVERFLEHLNKKYSDSYTAKANDWILYYSINDLKYKQARLIENHIKKMKSRKYIENLKMYAEISKKLIELYQ
ncbi:MAG TPA: GIY-YIG nuclease family protein, partial [Ginsengibacter sp.]